MRRNECSSRGDDRRSDAGPRRSRCSRCRGQACGRRARRPTDGGGTALQVPAQVRVGDDRRFTASGPIRLTVHRSQPVLPSAASTRCLVYRRQEERLGQGPDSGHGRSCPGVLPPFEIDRARTPASVRQAPAGRANEHAAPRELNSLPRAAGTGTDSRLPRWRFTNDRRPRLLTLPSIVRPPLSFISPSSRHSLLCGPVRPPGGRYLSDAGSLRSAPVGRKDNMLPNCGSTRCRRTAGSGTDSRLPRWRFTNDRRPRLLTFPSIVRPPLSRFTAFSSFPPLWSCPAARRPVPQ